MKFNYKEEYSTNEWQRKSGNKKHLDDYTCQICGSKKKQVHVHHHFYIEGRHLWEYPDETLITLCEDCHAKEHKFDNQELIEVIEKARKTGVMALEIIKAIKNLMTPLETHIPEGVTVTPASYKSLKWIAPKTPPFKKSININDKKKDFLDKLEKYGVTYPTQYLQSFANYWGETIDKKKDILRFENEDSFFLPTYLRNWEEKQHEIKLKEEYDTIISKAQAYAEEQYQYYYSQKQDEIIKLKNTTILEIEKNKECIFNLYKKREEELKKLKLNSIFLNSPSKKNIYDYITSKNLPAIIGQCYMTESKKEKDLNNNIITLYKGTKLHKNIEYKRIKLIESHLGLSILKTIDNRFLNKYIIDETSYIERQKRIYLQKYPQHTKTFEKNSRHPIWEKAQLTLQDFSTIYTANFLLNENAKLTIEKINKLDNQIMLKNFCENTEINAKEYNNISLKSYLKSIIDIHNPLASFNTFNINAECGFIRITVKITKIPVKLFAKLNKELNFNFPLCSLIIKGNHQGHITHYSHDFYGLTGIDFTPPINILLKTNNYEFDFCAENFNNGTMQSVNIMDNNVNNLPYYLNKIQQIINIKD